MDLSASIFFALTLFNVGCGTAAKATEQIQLPDGKRIEELTHLTGKMDNKEGVFRVSFPRADLKAEATGVSLTPPLGVTAWAAFKRTGNESMVMGDVVVTENELTPVMDAALNGGLEVTSLHNHFLWEKPRVMFMHIGGMGSEEKLAKAVGMVFDELKEIIKHPLRSPRTSTKIEAKLSNLDTKRISEIIGAEGDLTDGVFKITIGRSTKMHGFEMGKAMGVNTWAAFAGKDQEAVVDGDFAMLESELQGVLKALRSSGIYVVSIHNHMINETPRIVFLHYWGIGPARSLAEGVRKALDTTKH